MNNQISCYYIRVHRTLPQDQVAAYLADILNKQGLIPVRFLGKSLDAVSFSDIYKFEVEQMNKSGTVNSLVQAGKIIGTQLNGYQLSSVLMDVFEDSKKTSKKKTPKVKTLKTKTKELPKIEVNFDMITYNDPGFYIPEEWTQILKETHGNGFIAGGAIRDLELGAAVKDIDIFINVENEADYKDKVQWIVNHLGTSDVKQYYGEYQTDTNGLEPLENDVGLITKIKTESYSYDLVGRRGIDTLDKVVAQFDLGICQIGYDGTKIQCSENYIRDKACKTITILKPMKYGTKGWEHMERVCKKYSNYKLV